jgi:hypothetical protein
MAGQKIVSIQTALHEMACAMEFTKFKLPDVPDFEFIQK